MIKFALCGNIASGKSTVQKLLENHGYKVLDTDKVAHELLTVNNSELYLVFKNLDVFENGEVEKIYDLPAENLINHYENIREGNNTNEFIG